MRKNLIIGLLTIVSLSSIVYGYSQKVRADEQEALAIESKKIAREAKIQAEQMQKEVEMERQIANMMAMKVATEAKGKN